MRALPDALGVMFLTSAVKKNMFFSEAQQEEFKMDLREAKQNDHFKMLCGAMLYYVIRIIISRCGANVTLRNKNDHFKMWSKCYTT